MSHLLVIGGTKGLGRDFLASALSAHKRITVIARSVPTANSATPHVRYIAADVAVPTSLLAGLEQAIADGGPVHHVVFFQQYRGQTTPWDSKLACILTATRRALDFLQGHFAATGDKAVVFLTSTASRFAADEQDEGYHAAKTGLLGLCRYYAFKLGPLGVRVNCVSPGTVLKEESKRHFLDNPERHEFFRQAIPLRRMGTAAEVSCVIGFLLSPAASFMTGQELVVDGGTSLHSQESMIRSLFNAGHRRA